MDRPKVIIIQEASLDGKLAVSPDRPLLFGDERWEMIRGTRNSNLFKWLMTVNCIQATLEGSNSFVRETDTHEKLSPFVGDKKRLYMDYLPEGIVHREGHCGWFMAVDGRGRVRWMYKDGFPGDDTWNGWHLLVLVSHTTPPEYLAYLQHEMIPYLVSGNEKVDLEVALMKAKHNLGVDTVLSTAGGKLNGFLIKAGLVDEVNIEILPGIIGGNNAPSLFSGHVLTLQEKPTQLELLSCTCQSTGQVWLRYRVISFE
jgi:2,5-diamino-6-(ribosylamino)-4(3H)-pyrimidinone 5'-phosphate reductase